MLVIEIAAGILLAKVAVALWDSVAERFENASPLWGLVLVVVVIGILAFLERK